MNELKQNVPNAAGSDNRFLHLLFCKGLEGYLKYVNVHYLTVPGQGKDYSYGHDEEHLVRTMQHSRSFYIRAILFLHHHNCERHHYPHIIEPGILEKVS